MEARRNFLRRFCFFLFHSSLTCVVCAVFLFLASRLILSHWRSVERAQRNIAKVVDPVQSVLGMQIRFASAIVGYCSGSMHVVPDFCIGFQLIPRNDPRSRTTISLSAEVYASITTLVDRAVAGDIFLSALAAHVTPVPRTESEKRESYGSRGCQLLLTYAVPGGGKSFFLDQLAARKGRLFGSSSLPEMDELLKDAIFVNISYGGIQHGGPKTSSVQGLAIRLLHS